MKRDIRLLYVGAVVPDEPEYWNPAFSRAGSMFQENLLRAMSDAGLSPTLVLSVRHQPSFPAISRIWFCANEVTLKSGQRVSLLPFLNITPIKQIQLGIAAFLKIIAWGWRNRHGPRVVLSYNLSVPPGFFTLAASRLIGATALVSLNDVHIPGHTVKKSLLNHLDFWMQKILIPRFDGHIVVSEAIATDFIPHGRPYLRVEGGVTDAHFLQGKRHKTHGVRPFTVVFAGTLNEANGIPIILESMSLVLDPGVRLVIAGKGPLEPLVRSKAAVDPRVEYRGQIPYDEVLDLYSIADVLLNIRITTGIDTRYFFPSKVMEYLASGIPVLTTSTGHIQEEFGQFVVMLKEETPSRLAQCLTELSKMPSDRLLEIGGRAQCYMRINKTWKAQGKRVVDYISFCVSKG